MKKTEWIFQLFRCAFVAITFFAVDFTLRYFTRWLGYYSIFELAPSLFSICWIALFMVALTFIPRKAGRIAYAIWYGIWAIYAVCQYVYYLIFNKFFFLSDIYYAGEGGNYLDYVSDVLNGDILLVVVLYVILGFLGFLLFPDYTKIGNKSLRRLLRSTLIVASSLGMVIIPSLYVDVADAPFLGSKYEYSQFTNSGFDLEIAGLYQYVAKDTWNTYLKSSTNNEDLFLQVEAFLDEKSTHEDNAMTGVLKGKNLILVQLESLDDWVINHQSAPTISWLMENGVNFTNMHTCLYGSGSTFSTEFAINTGIYQSVKNVAAYSCSRNAFPLSLAGLLRNAGYTANSFHENVGGFYNRNIMHTAMGYQQYYSLIDFVDVPQAAEFDEALVTTDQYWDMITGTQPFFSFLITYSAHVPYSDDNALVQHALEKHPEYNAMDIDCELRNLYAKVRLTDDLFTSLLVRLEKDDLLDNTVIIAYADHYCYGLSDKELVRQLSEANGSTIMERTPAFIWYEGCESMEVDKICQTIDWVPTIANLFGQDVTPYVLGNDIFDPNYEGYAIFPDGTWLTESTYVVNGVPRWNNGMTDQEIADMNAYVQSFYQANEAILASDYYAQFTD